MKIGVTGTRKGATLEQLVKLNDLLELAGPGLVVAHGDCVGVDAQSDMIARRLNAKIRVYPPSAGTWRAWCGFKGELYLDRVILKPQPYMERNRAIVDWCDLLIIVPQDDVEEWQDHRNVGGTWATARYGRRVNKPSIIVWPRGKATGKGIVILTKGEESAI